jgi:hypothetical protein
LEDKVKRSTVIWISVIFALIFVASVSTFLNEAKADYQDPAQVRMAVEQLKIMNRNLDRIAEALEEHNRIYRNELRQFNSSENSARTR